MLSKYVAVAFVWKVPGSRLVMVSADHTAFLFRAPCVFKV